MNLLILNYEYPPLGGGAGVCSKYQAEGLASFGHKVIVITTWYRGEKEIEESENLKIIRVKSKRKKEFQSNPLEMLSWAFKAYSYIRKNDLQERIDLIITHFAIPGGFVTLPLFLFKKTPYYIVSHGQDIPWFAPKELFIYHLLFYFPIKWICARASKLILLSEKRLRDANKLLAPKHHLKNIIIPNGCDTSFFTPSKEQRSWKELKIIFVGRLRKQKDPFTLLHAIHELSVSGIPFSLEIMGNGPFKKRMQDYVINKRLEENITFLGWLSKAELREKYQEAHLLVITSLDEGMSLSNIEALACGLYIISTPVSGSDLIQPGINGSFFPFEDAKKLSEAIQEFYHTHFRQQYTIPAEFLEEFRNSVSWEHYSKAYHELIEK